MSRGNTWENAGTNNTSSKVSALPSRRMGKAPDAKRDYTDRYRAARPRLTDVTPGTRRRALHWRHALRLPARTALTALLCTLALATLALPAQAQWKWRDANGRVTVSDLPPPRDVPPTRTSCSDPTRPSCGPRQHRPRPPRHLHRPPAVDRELQARREATVREQAAREKADAARLNEQRAENCRNARAHLSALDSRAAHRAHQRQGRARDPRRRTARRRIAPGARRHHVGLPLSLSPDLSLIAAPALPRLR